MPVLMEAKKKDREQEKEGQLGFAQSLLFFPENIVDYDYEIDYDRNEKVKCAVACYNIHFDENLIGKIVKIVVSVNALDLPAL